MCEIYTCVQHARTVQVHLFLLTWLMTVTCAVWVSSGTFAGLLLLAALVSVGLLLRRFHMLPVLFPPHPELPSPRGLNFPHSKRGSTPLSPDGHAVTPAAPLLGIFIAARA